MRRFWLGAWLFLLLGLCHAQAHAGLKFGKSERIRFVANVTLQGPAGERLYLARKLTEHSFLLPYAMDDDGYVLGISGESNRYFQLPTGPRLDALQAEGFLPKPLPPFERDWVDRLFGHALWVGLALLLPYLGWQFRPRKAPPGADRIEPSIGTARPIPTEPPGPYSGRAIALPMQLATSRRKVLLMLAIAIAFVALGLWLAKEQPLPGYLCAGFFGLGIPIFALQLLPGRSFLRLEREGFTIGSLFKTTTVAWNAVGAFRVITLSHNKMVGWNYLPGQGPRTGAAMARALAGTEAALPDTYGMKAQDLADLMNELRRRTHDPVFNA